MGERLNRAQLARKEFRRYLHERNTPRFDHNPRVVKGVISAVLILHSSVGEGQGSIIYPGHIGKQDRRAARMRLDQEHRLGSRVVFVNGIEMENGTGAEIILMEKIK